MKVASFFSGLGGLDVGFQSEGFDVVWANEYDKTIFPSYRANHPDTTLDTRSIMDLTEDDIPDVDGFIGGPPCQSWSAAGANNGATDSRGKCFFKILDLLKQKKPKFFVLENVKGILAEKHKGALADIIDSFGKSGYRVFYKCLNASGFDVPQDRERVIFVGFLDHAIEFEFPTPSEHKTTLRRTIEAIKINPVGTKRGKTSGALDEYLEDSYSSRFMSRNRVRSIDEPSFTIPATARQIPLHPSAPPMVKTGKDVFVFVENATYRRLSVRECLRIQTFPETYKLVYSNIEHAYKMIGNAVPVNLAKAVASRVKTHFESLKKK